MTIYMDIVMSILETISMMSKSGYSDRELLEYIDKHYDEIECELNGEEYITKGWEPKKRDHYFCMGCRLKKTVDYERSILTCTKCGVFEYYPVYVSSYNKPSRRKCIYKRYDNFKVILNQFFYGGRGLFQMMLWLRLRMKYTMKLTYCTTTSYQ